MNDGFSRRELLVGGMAAAALPAVGLASVRSSCTVPKPTDDKPFPVSLNTATLRGHKLPITEVIDIAAEAGYHGIEPWPDELDRFVEQGGKLSDLKRRLADHGLAVTGAIAFYPWMVNDDSARAKAIEEARRRMGVLAEIGGTYIAAPPAGEVAGVDLLIAAERYRALLEVSEGSGIIPAVEIWGGAANVSRLGQAVMIAVEADHPKACVLPDVFHLYKGGSPLSSVRHLAPGMIAGLHLNDYPADPPRKTIADKDRVYPGDGIAPLEDMLRGLWKTGYRGAVSVELFNPAYYQQEPRLVARTALEKTRQVLQKAFGTSAVDQPS